MKIGIVIETFRSGGGGNERSTLQIATRLLQRGHDVTIFTNRTNYGEGELDGLNIVSAEGYKTSHSLGLKRFVRWAVDALATNDLDVSISMTTAVPADIVQPRSGTVMQTLKQNILMRPNKIRQLAKRFIVSTSPKQNALLAAERITLASKSVKYFAANSQYVVDQLCQLYHVPQEKIVMIPNASEVQVEKAALEPLRQEKRKALNLNDDQTVFLFVAMNPRLKGALQLLEAWAKVVAEEDKAVLVFVGKQAADIEARSKALGLNQHVRVVGKTENMSAMYAACDVVILPTFYDPSSKVILEGLLHGKPSISTAHNGASQWIIDPMGKVRWQSALGSKVVQPLVKGKAGFVIASPYEVEAMAMAMLAMCVKAGREQMQAQLADLDPALNMDHHVATLEKLMQSIVDAK